jgi:hypothetical protein
MKSNTHPMITPPHTPSLSLNGASSVADNNDSSSDEPGSDPEDSDYEHVPASRFILVCNGTAGLI